MALRLLVLVHLFAAQAELAGAAARIADGQNPHRVSATPAQIVQPRLWRTTRSISKPRTVEGAIGLDGSSINYLGVSSHSASAWRANNHDQMPSAE